MENPTICVPGQRLCRVEGSIEGGRGTYSLDGSLYSSVAGHRVDKSLPDDKVCVDVVTVRGLPIIPDIGYLVSARVVSVNPRFCRCHILSVEGRVLREHFKGILRREDVRATEKDKVEMYKCFRPGDIILAKVLMMGEALSYLLTTADNTLGVVIAKSEAGGRLVPISWCEMQCPITMTTEKRKVARVQPEYIDQLDR